MKVEFETGDISRIRIGVSVFNKELIAHIYYDGKEVDNKLGVDFVNALIKKVCIEHSLKVTDLFAMGVLSIESDKVWTKYDYNPIKEEFIKKVIVKSTPSVVKEKIVDPIVTPVVPPVVKPVPAVNVEETTKEAPVVETKEEVKEEVKEEKTETKEEKKETKKEVKEETTTKEKTKKSNNRIRNLKILAGVTAIALLGGIVGCELAGGKKDVVGNKNYDNDNNKSKIENQVSNNSNYGLSDNDEVIYNEPSNEIVVGYNEPIEFVEYREAEPMNKEYYYLGSDVYDTDMETQIQVINDECFKYTPNTLYELVYANDRDALFAIINKRNGLFNSSCSVNEFLNEAVNYIFECGIVFDGKQIKSFDSLSPFGQYMVLVATQSVLQLSPEYNHSTPNNHYNYDALVNSFDYMVDSTYRVLMNNKKTY